MNKLCLTIATRKSPLALWQANWVKSCLQNLYPELNFTILGITTTADKVAHVPLRTIGGKDLFVKELEEALLEERADLAVHSMKDLPMGLPAGLCLPIICEREAPQDAFISNEYNYFSELPNQALVGTSSLRRQSQLYARKPTLKFINIRGNVGTRLAYLDRGEATAIVLAAAGLKRLNLQGRISSLLTFEECLPAAGQGALGIECRENDTEVQSLIAPLNHLNSFTCVTAERAVCKRLGASCQVPVGAYAQIINQHLLIRALIARPDGKVVLTAHASGEITAAEALGRAVAENLLDQGAAAILTLLGVNHDKF